MEFVLNYALMKQTCKQAEHRSVIKPHLSNS